MLWGIACTPRVFQGKGSVKVFHGLQILTERPRAGARVRQREREREREGGEREREQRGPSSKETEMYMRFRGLVKEKRVITQKRGV